MQLLQIPVLWLGMLAAMVPALYAGAEFRRYRYAEYYSMGANKRSRYLLKAIAGWVATAAVIVLTLWVDLQLAQWGHAYV